jgi:hypothetical protein
MHNLLLLSVIELGTLADKYAQNEHCNVSYSVPPWASLVGVQATVA